MKSRGVPLGLPSIGVHERPGTDSDQCPHDVTCRKPSNSTPNDETSADKGSKDLSALLGEATEALILDYNPRWTGAGGFGIYPQWTGIETFSYDEDVAYSHEGWRGRIRASAGIGASLPADAVQKFDVRHAAMLEEHFPPDVLTVPHRVWVLIAGKGQ